MEECGELIQACAKVLKHGDVEKHNLSEEALELLLFGDESVLNSKYRSISSLEHRWCLKSILDYHLNMTYKITRKQYDSFFGL